MRQLLLLFIIVFLAGCATTTARFPGNSLADPVLQKNAAQIVMLLESAEPTRCVQRKIVDTEVAEQPGIPGKDPWLERWTVDRCGSLVYYKVKFMPPIKGGTDVSVTVWE